MNNVSGNNLDAINVMNPFEGNSSLRKKKKLDNEWGANSKNTETINKANIEGINNEVNSNKTSSISPLFPSNEVAVDDNDIGFILEGQNYKSSSIKKKSKGIKSKLGTNSKHAKIQEIPLETDLSYITATNNKNKNKNETNNSQVSCSSSKQNREFNRHHLLMRSRDAEKLISQLSWEKKTVYLSRHMFGGATMNGFTRATACAQRLKKQRNRQLLARSLKERSDLAKLVKNTTNTTGCKPPNVESDPFEKLSMTLGTMQDRATDLSNVGAVGVDLASLKKKQSLVTNLNKNSDTTISNTTSNTCSKTDDYVDRTGNAKSEENPTKEACRNRKEGECNKPSAQEAEEQIKKLSMNHRMHEKISLELKLGISFCNTIESTILSILSDIEPIVSSVAPNLKPKKESTKLVHHMYDIMRKNERMLQPKAKKKKQSKNFQLNNGNEITDKTKGIQSISTQMEQVSSSLNLKKRKLVNTVESNLTVASSIDSQKIPKEKGCNSSTHSTSSSHSKHRNRSQVESKVDTVKTINSDGSKHRVHNDKNGIRSHSDQSEPKKERITLGKRKLTKKESYREFETSRFRTLKKGDYVAAKPQRYTSFVWIYFDNNFIAYFSVLMLCDN